VAMGRLPAICALLGVVCLAAEDDAVLEIVGRGVEGREPYRGGKVEFLDVSIADQLIHLGEGDSIPLRLSIAYNVLEPAPILLNSRMGTEYWYLYHYADDALSGLYTREQIDLSAPGEAIAQVEEATLAARYGVPLTKGLVGLRGHYYFLVDQPNGEWLDVIDPPAFFDSQALAEKLVFTLANLEDFELEFTDIQSTWEPGGPVRVKLTVTDADGDSFPVVNVQGTISDGDWEAPLTAHVDHIHVPTGWLTSLLPEDRVPERVEVRATVSAMTPDGPRQIDVAGSFRSGDGRKDADEMFADPDAVEIPRNADGVLRETRALWVNPKSFNTREGVERLAADAKRAGLNTLIADIFVRNAFYASGELMPMAGDVEEGLDPLAYLIERAHADGIEVHPWFCVTYRDARFRERLPDVDMIDADGEVIALGADVHRPAYRDFIVNLMVGVAGDYDVDGIHLDYIRTMGRCYCGKCRAEFEEAFETPLAEASDEDWVAWQRQAIGDIVRRTAEGVREAKPDAIMSAAVFSNVQSGASQGQDPAEWARRGWIDVVIPMDYQMQTLAVRANERRFLAALDDGEQLVSGLSLYKRVAGQAQARDPALVEEQIKLVRSMGIHGYCLFVHSYLTDEIAKMLQERVNQKPAVPFFR